jgi:hypothetical protein
VTSGCFPGRETETGVRIRLHLSTAKREFLQREPILLTVSLQNTGRRCVLLPPLDVARGEWSEALGVTDDTFRSMTGRAPMTSRTGIDMEPNLLPRRDDTIPIPEGPPLLLKEPEKPWALEPHESRTLIVDLVKLFGTVPPGQYRVRFRYWADGVKGLGKSVSLALVSNEVTVRVVPRKP